MAKASKGGKHKPRRHNPVRVPDTHLGSGVQAAEATSAKKGQVIPVLEKLDSPDVEDRRWACAAVTNLIQNDASTRRLLQAKGVVDKLITRLSDSEEDVAAEAVGSLRNLAVDGGYDMCAHMFNKNVLAPLKAFVPKITSVLQQYLGPSPPKHSEGIEKRIYEFAENVITLFWCLSETSNKALNAINAANLIPFLMAFLISKDKIPLKAVVASAQCLYVLSDDNDPAIQAIRSTTTYVTCLLGLAKDSESDAPSDGMVVEKPLEEEQKVALKVLACGILKNISPLPALGPIPPVDLERAIALPLLVPLLSYSLAETSTRVHELVTAQALHEKSTDPKIGLAPKSDHKTPEELELEKIETRLRTIALSLEIMTGICAKLPDPEPSLEEDVVEDEMEDADEEDELVDDDEADEAIIDDIQPDSTPDLSTSSTLSLVAALTQPLLALAQPTPLSFPPPSSPPVHPPTASALSTIHIRALECLNNLFLGITVDSTKLPEGTSAQVAGVWRDVWMVLVAVGKQSEWTVGSGDAELRKEMWEVAVGVLWGLARIGKGELVPDAEQVAALVEFCDWNTDEVIKVKCIGTLGCLAQRGDAVEANKVISSYLFTYLTASLPSTTIPYPEATLHAASSLIDIFADEDKPYDINWRQMQWTEALAGSKDRVKRAGKAIDRKREGAKELREFAEEVLANVVGFVQYRRKLEKKMANGVRK